MSYEEILQEIEKLPVEEQAKLDRALEERRLRKFFPDLDDTIKETEEAIKNNELINTTVNELFDGLINED